MEEIWKDIEGYEGYYQVSNFGNVRSLDRIISGKRYKGNLIKCIYDCRGYKRVGLTKNKITKNFTVHRLVANAFIPNPEKKNEIDHINTNTGDARVDNLRWVTHSENMNNIITKERMNSITYSPDVIKKAMKTRLSRGRLTAPKCVYQFTLEGKFLRKFDSLHEAALLYGVKGSDISGVCVGKRGRRSVAGYMWSFSMECGQYKPYATKCKKLAQYDKDGHLIKVWDSFVDATTSLGINNISRAANPRSKKSKAGGYYWRYIA